MPIHGCRLFALLLGLLFIPATGFADDPAPVSETESETAGGEESAERPVDYYKLMKTIVDTFEQIDRNFVEEVDTQTLTDAAIRGMLEELDPYSSYIKPEQLTRFNRSVDQEFGGIGIQVSVDPKTRRLTVLTPLPGTPAYKAGIRAGDIIEEIEGESTEGWSLEDAIEKLKGAIGEPVSIGVRHLGEDEVDELSVTREIIQVATVLGDQYKANGDWDFMLDPERKIGYIRLTHFSRRSSDELHDALKTLQSQGMRGLILDLRNNPGGLLTQAVEICDMFVESGRIVSTKGRNSPERVWTAKKAGTFSDFPMAILINRYSASASEITSACLQDHDRAVVIGERSWGKGSVQNVIDLEGGNAALKLTTASYHRPSGKNIHRKPDASEDEEWGVMPNEGYVIKFSPKELQKYLDYRRSRDVLGGTKTEPSDYEDKQLAAAVKYLIESLSKADDSDEGEAVPEDQPAEAVPAAALPRLMSPTDIANHHNSLRIPRTAGL